MEQRPRSAGSDAVSTSTSSSDLYQNGTIATVGSPADVAGQKRKRIGDDIDSVDKKRRTHSVDGTGSSSIQKTEPDCAGLTVSIWQQICSYLEPKDLVILSWVCRPLQRLLSEPLALDGQDAWEGTPSSMKPGLLWTRVMKRLDYPGAPRPLPGYSPLEMWKLLAGTRCQFCNRKPRIITSTPEVWRSGPGRENVRIVWPFGVRACGACLEPRMQRDTSLLFSSISALLSGLPYAFLTPALHYISASTLQTATLPATIQVNKFYYKPHIEEIERQFAEVRQLGPAATEEWGKGLDSKGQERLDAAMRWEKWDEKGGLRSLHSQQIYRPRIEPPILPVHQLPTVHQLPPYTAPSPATPFPALQNRTFTPNNGPYVPPPIVAQPAQPQSTHQGPPRNLRDITEAKAQRKAEIERRCMELNPPIPPNVLRHMDSFQAALQIPAPLNENSWQMLRSRLEAQREAAEQTENDRAAQLRDLQLRMEEQRRLDPNSKEAKEALDKEWDEAQAPIRARLGAFADEIIERDWDNGILITKEKSPQFAVDVLMHVRKRFYEELANKQDPVITGQKLVLDHMKWIFDNKIKPLTDGIRKELFICSASVPGGNCEGNFRYYGFEGVIQHYGAKHTSAFSLGNIVVHWPSAEWPEEPPFHTNPTVAKAEYYSSTPSVQAPPSVTAPLPYSYGGYSRGAAGTPAAGASYTQMSPGPYHPQFGAHVNGPYAPPQSAPSAYPAPAQGFPGGYNGFPQATGTQVIYPVAQQPSEAYNSYSGQPAIAALHPYGTQAAVYATDYAGYPPLATGQGSQQPSPVVANQAGPAQATPQMNGSAVQDDVHFEEHSNELAAIAKEIWSNLAKIRDLPQSVKLRVLVHHVIDKFKIRFGREPTFHLFFATLANHKLMSSVRNAYGVACKVCVTGEPGLTSSSNVERKICTVYTLVQHFKQEHFEKSRTDRSPAHESIRSPDWRTDLVDLPEDRVISETMKLRDMDDETLQLLAEAFPGLFPSPLPRLRPAKELVAVRNDEHYSPAVPGIAKSSSAYSKARHPERYAKTERELRRDEIYGASGRRHETATDRLYGPNSNDDSPEGSPRPREDEYDPRRPATVEVRRDQLPRHRNRVAYHRNAELGGLQHIEHRVPVYAAEGVGELSTSSTDEKQTDHLSLQAYDVYYSTVPKPYVRRQSPTRNEPFLIKRDIQDDQYSVGGPEERPTSKDRPLNTNLSTPLDSVPQSSYSQPSGHGRTGSRTEGQSAAERFLNDFVPGQGFEQYHKNEQDIRHNNEDNLGSQWPPTKEQAESRKLGADLPAPSDNGGYLTGPSSLQPTPAPPSQYAEDGASSQRISRDDERYVRTSGSRYERAVEPGRAQYVRRHEPYLEASKFHPDQRMVRASSRRYERYEAQKRMLDREASGSPPSARETTQYRGEGSPEPQGYDRFGYAGEPRRVSGEPLSHDSGYYEPAPAPAVYYRAQEPRPVLSYDEYGNPIQIIRVREPVRDVYPPPRYINERGELVEYVQYPRAEPAYDSRQYVYYPEPERREYARYEGELDRRRYEPEPMPLQQGREIRYTEQHR